MKYFGTDGIRGKAGEDLNNYLVAKLGQALASYLRQNDEKLKVVIARDTRISGKEYEETLARVLSDFGVEVIILGIVPTPVSAFYIRHFQAGAGVVISASHNPPEFNGLKIFDSRGYKFTENEEDKIEAFMDMNTVNPSKSKGAVTVLEDNYSEYANYIINKIKPDLKNMRIYLDCSEGAAYKLAPYIFKRLTKNLFVMADSGQGELINHNCGATQPQFLAEKVKQNKCDIGFSFDGDADRLIAIDSDGTIIDGDYLLYMHAVDMKERGVLYKDTLVGTVMSNLGFANALKQQGIRLIREAVGDKYVFDRMINKGYNIGGEQSGHIIFLDYQTTGDGILSAVLTADLVSRTGKTLKELSANIIPCPQRQTFIVADAELKRKYEMSEELGKEITNLCLKLGDDGRILVRPSGTEPKIRIMVEAATDAICEEYLMLTESVIREKLKI